MDKNTLSNYGWIVICTLVLAVMLALATPFGEFIAGAFKATYAGFGNVTDNALAVIGIGNGGNGGSGNTGDTGEDNEQATQLTAPTRIYCDYDWENLSTTSYWLVIENPDVNTEGYYVYIYDELVATIGVDETYTFPGKTGDDMIPFKVIAFAEGYENSEPTTSFCNYGYGAGDGYDHIAPTVTLSGKTLTIVSNSYSFGEPDGDEFNIYVDGVAVDKYRYVSTAGTEIDLSSYLYGATHEITVETNCHPCSVTSYYEGGLPSVTVNYTADNTPVINKVAPIVEIKKNFLNLDRLFITPQSTSDGVVYSQAYEIYVNGELAATTTFFNTEMGYSASSLGIEAGVEYTFTVIDLANDFTVEIVGSIQD